MCLCARVCAVREVWLFLVWHYLCVCAAAKSTLLLVCISSETISINFTDLHAQMKGIPWGSHNLQIIILIFSSFFLLGSFTQFVVSAITNCSYHQNGHDDNNETDNKYEIECIGNSITAASYGLVSILTLVGMIVAWYRDNDADIIIAFVIFGVLVSYTCDVLTNLIVNCTAGDTSDQNLFDDATYDSAASKCKAYAYGTAGGCVGILGGFMSGYYGIKMVLYDGKFYIQRPIGLFLAMFGYAAVFSFNALATAYPVCHYYDEGKEQLPNDTPPYVPIEDDLVYNQLEPVCAGYIRTAIGYGAAAFVALCGVLIMFRFHKRGMWVVLGVFLALGSSSNYSTFEAIKLSSCNNTDNYVSNLPISVYSSYQESQFESSCEFYGISMKISIVATTCASLAALISFVDTAIHIEHDTLIIRVRRALFFCYAVCFALSNSCGVLSTLLPDCDLLAGSLDDDGVSAETDDQVESAHCHGKIAQLAFYLISGCGCVIGIVASIVFNFPEHNVAVGLMGLDDGGENAKDDKEKLLGGDFH
jgi:hypothetical protein